MKILANGDIVQDDDPRVRSPPATRQRGNQPQRQAYAGDDGNQGQQQVNLFTVLNQRLLAFGIPRWNIGELVVEPIVSVGLLLALLLFGIHGLIFGAILFAVSQWSTNGAPDFVTNLFGGAGARGGGEGRNNRPHGRSGGGYILGR